MTYNAVPNDASVNLAASINRIREALAAPLGVPALRELARGKVGAVILIPDGTRLCPSPLLLQPLLAELEAAGIPRTALDIVVALGIHRRHTPGELENLVGTDIYRTVRVCNHSPASEDCVQLGTTRRGTPVEIFRLAAEAPLRITIGNVEPHGLVGISGGVKTLVPGVASRRCIEHNHGLSVAHPAQAGQLDNAVLADLEEAQTFAPVHFAVNVIVDHDRQVLHAAAGDVVAVHRAMAARAAERFFFKTATAYDVTVVSAGGHPRDQQLYQAIKSLRNAAAFTRPGGTIILLAHCPEMIGNGTFQEWIETKPSRERMTQQLREHFVLGAHKMLHLDEVLRSHTVYLHSIIPDVLVELLEIKPVYDVEVLLAELYKQGQTHIAVMPFGGMTFKKTT